MIAVGVRFLVCVASSLGTTESLCKLIPKSQYHLKKFTHVLTRAELDKCLRLIYTRLVWRGIYDTSALER